MRIAQVAPLIESVPPKLYGGTERVVSFLTEELVRLGHRVTLFASADSRTRATLLPMCPEALRLRGSCVDQVTMHVMMLERVVAQAHEFDVIHFHTSQLHYPVMRRLPHVRHVTTLQRADAVDDVTAEIIEPHERARLAREFLRHAAASRFDQAHVIDEAGCAA